MDSETARFARHWWANRDEAFFPNRWLGVPALQNPFDVWVIQEILFETRPDVVVETGTFGGGGAVLWASLCRLMDRGRVISIDIDPRLHAGADELGIVEERVEFVEGSSTDPAVADRVRRETAGERVMVILDSDHSADHVRAELDLWGPIVSEGCYLVAEDGFVTFADPEHGPGPLEAVQAWLPDHPEFEADEERERMLFTFCPSGFLRRRA